MQAADHAGIRETSEAVRIPFARERHPVGLFVLAQDDPAQVQAPGRIVDCRREAELTQRDGDLDVPTLLVDRGPVLPDDVPVVVDGAAVLDGVGVLERPERVGAEVEAVSVIVERVDDDLQLIAA
jgi:hypothetical protein